MKKLPSRIPKQVYLFIFPNIAIMVGYSAILELFVFYAVQKIHISRAEAYIIYSSFASLLYISHIITGYIAGKFFGYRFATGLGLLLLTIGLLALAFPFDSSIFIGLGFFIIGAGIYVTSFYGVLDSFYNEKSTQDRNSGFTVAYTEFTTGALIGFISAGFINKYFGFANTYIFASVLIFIALLYFLFHCKKFSTTEYFWQRKLKGMAILLGFGVIAVILLLFPRICEVLAVTACIIGSLIILRIAYVRKNKKLMRFLYLCMIVSAL